jgi:2-methylcitrate dehydratase PrpD
MVNSVFARSYDFEPTGALVEGKSTPSHISGTTVPAALAVAELKGASGKELLTAMILGDDLASRIVAASQLNIDSGWDSTGTVNVFGAAAVAGKLWGLNERQMVNTFGIAINQMAGTFLNIFDYAHTFKLPQGLAAQAGIFSAA